MGSKLIYGLHANPIIAAISHGDALNAALESDVQVIFLLKCNILEIKDAVKKAKEKGKAVFVHADLVEGLSKDTMGLEYIINEVKPDGIITTKSHLVRFAKSKNVIAIQRLFILDSLNLRTGIDSVKSCRPDAVEILPGVMPKITDMICKATGKPVITGGLIQSKQDVMDSLGAGAIGISTSNKDIWEL